MALSDIDSNEYYWYYGAYNNMEDYETATSENFGTGEENTQTMISKWNSSEYGEQTISGKYTDIWGENAIQSGIYNGSSGWYIPSRGEWTAFASKLEITNSNYKAYGLSDSCWTSSQVSHNCVYRIDFDFSLGSTFGERTYY